MSEMKQRVKILHLFGAMERGGAETRTVEVMRNLDRNRYDFHFAVSRSGSLDDEVRALGGTIHCHPLKKFDPLYTLWFRKLLRKENFDAIHSHIHYASGYFVRLANQAGIPQRIVHFRSTQDGKQLSVLRKLQLWLMRSWIDRYATHILAVSNASMSSSWPEHENDLRCQVIYNGLDLAQFRAGYDREKCRKELGYTNEDSVIIHVGRHTAAKNCPRLLSVFSGIKHLRPNAKLLLVGIGNDAEEQEIDRLIKKLGIEESVHRTGRRIDVPRLLWAADMMLFPSLWEGLPGAVLEACAAGLPILASDIASIQEIKKYFSNVTCFSLQESDRQWSQMVDQLLTNSCMVCQDRKEALERFNQSPFSLSENIRQLCSKWHLNDCGLDVA